MSEKTVDAVDAVEKEQVNVKTSSGGLLLNGGENGIGELGGWRSGRREERVEVKRTSSSKRDSDLRRWMTASLMSLEMPRRNCGGLVGEDVAGGEVWGSVVERMGLEE